MSYSTDFETETVNDYTIIYSEFTKTVIIPPVLSDPTEHMVIDQASNIYVAHVCCNIEMFNDCNPEVRTISVPLGTVSRLAIRNQIEAARKRKRQRKKNHDRRTRWRAKRRKLRQ